MEQNLIHKKVADVAVSAPFVVRDEFFGGVVYVRESGAYLAFDKDVIKVLRLSQTLPLDEVFNRVYGSREHLVRNKDSKDYLRDFQQLISCFESRNMIVDKRFAGVFLNNEVPAGCANLVAPLEVDLQLTNYCQFSCRHCWIDQHGGKGRTLNALEIKALLDHLAKIGAFIVNLRGGQAIARNDFEDLVNYATSAGLLVNLSTNVSNISERYYERLSRVQLHEIKVGVVAGTEKTWNCVRGGQAFRQFKRGMQRIADYVRVHPGCRVVFSAVLSDENREDLASIVKLVNTLVSELHLEHSLLRVNLALPVPTTDGWKNPSCFLPAKRVLDILGKVREYARTRTAADLLEITTDCMLPNTSFKRFSSSGFGCSCGILKCFISAQGFAYPSGILSNVFPADASNNLRLHTLSEIWNQSQSFRNLRNIGCNEVCAKCEYLKFCHGGCRSRAYLYARNRSAMDPWCELQHLEVRHGKRAKD